MIVAKSWIRPDPSIKASTFLSTASYTWDTKALHVWYQTNIIKVALIRMLRH
jgi:hypothetical protein